jgi:CHASE2 domain-containing sensor protein
VRPLWQRLALAVATAAAATAVALGAHAAGVLEPVERALLDERYDIRGDHPPDDSIAIVAIDEDTVAELGPPPYPRDMYAELVDRLRAAGARLIVFDVGFDSPRAGDAELRAAVRRAAPVVLGSTLIDAQGRTPGLGGAAAQRRIGARPGAALVEVEPDGELRRLPLEVRNLPAMAIVSGRILGAPPPDAGAFEDGGALIDYAGPAGTYPTHSLVAVLDGDVPARAFDGKAVLVGATARSLQDQHDTPRGVMPGVEIQANALASVLDGLPLREASTAATVLLAFLLALVAPLAAVRLPLPAALALSLGAAIAYLVAAQLAFDGGTVLDVSIPELAWLLSAAATLVGGYVVANRDRRRLREEFAALSPDVVDAVLSPGGGRALAPTAIVAGYRVDEMVGQGGMAVVWRATQVALERRVALKLIAPDHARDQRFRERFLRESRLAAAVEHPHVIPVYEAGDDDGLLYISMRYVDGLDLDAVLRRLGPPGSEEAVRICGQVAGALDAAHAVGLVHRDVKPANIMLDGEPPHAYLTDFGIARAAGATTGMTAMGTFVGSPDYAAPEQIAGEEVDARVDVYALTGVLYHALTGSVPFPRDDVLAVLMAHGSVPPPKPSEADPQLEPFDDVVAAGMAKARDDRPPTAGRLAALARDALAAARAAG